MRKLAETMVVATGLFLLVGTAGAASQSGDAAMLQDERQEHAWAAMNAKGVDKTKHREDEQRVQNLIDALQRGERVDPAAVDRELNRTR